MIFNYLLSPFSKKKKKNYLLSWLGMAIKTWPVGIQPGPTLMGRILHGQINNRVRYGFKKKKTWNGSRSSSGFMHTWLEPDRYTYTILNKIKNPRYKYSLSPIRFHFLNLNPLSLSLSVATHFYWSSNKPQYKSKSLLLSSSLNAVVVVIVFASLLVLLLSPSSLSQIW